MKNHEWINDERLASVPADKKEFFHQILFELDKLTKEEKLPFIMALLSSGRLNALKLTKEEMELIIQVLKDYTEEKELARFQGLLQMLHH